MSQPVSPLGDRLHEAVRGTLWVPLWARRPTTHTESTCLPHVLSAQVTALQRVPWPLKTWSVSDWRQPMGPGQARHPAQARRATPT